MEKHIELLPGSQLSEIAVFQQLATIAQQATIRESSSREASMAMLACLIECCAAQHGAVFLYMNGMHDREELPAPSSMQMNRVRTLAQQDVGKDEIDILLSLLASGNTGNPAIHMVPDVACWLAFRIDVGTVSMQHPWSHALTDENILDDLPFSLSPDGAFEQEKQTLQAMIALGWTGLDSRACIETVERSQSMLPVLTPAVGAVIAGILQVEDLKQLEAMRVRESLQGMELLKAELLATVSHELRSPLTSIKGYATTLLRHEQRLAREERHQFLLAIAESCDRMESSVERLLEMSELETQAITLVPVPVDVASLVKEAITALDTRLASHPPDRFTFMVRLQQSDGSAASSVPLIRADRRRMREVLDNLLENAVTYSPGGGTISVIIRPITREQFPGLGFPQHQQATLVAGTTSPRLPNMLLLSVCDTGMGIPMDQLERIFDRFYRVDRRLTRETNGLGLGLTICRRIVELHHGFIWAESLPGNGSALHVLLPLEDVHGCDVQA
jgi:signal transduction histidine kinase